MAQDTSGWNSRTRDSSDYESLFRNLHSFPSVFHFPPERLSLTFHFFFWSATLSPALVLLQAAGDTSPAARRHDKVPEAGPTRRHQQPRTVIGNTICGGPLTAAATNDPYGLSVFIKGGTCTDDRSCPWHHVVMKTRRVFNEQ